MNGIVRVHSNDSFSSFRSGLYEANTRSTTLGGKSLAMKISFRNSNSSFRSSGQSHNLEALKIKVFIVRINTSFLLHDLQFVYLLV